MSKRDRISWPTFWDQKAEAPTDFQATGRGVMDITGFLYTIREIAQLLELKRNDVLLDIGCGTGIIALALSPWVKHIHGVDISPSMIQRAKDNCDGLDNVTFAVGDARDLGGRAGTFDKILGYSVLQYLDGEQDVSRVFQHVRRCLKPKGVALFAANPDPELKEKYLARLEQTRPHDYKLVLELMGSTLWLSRNIMVELATSEGLRAEAVDIDSHIWQHFYMFNLLVRHE